MLARVSQIETYRRWRSDEDATTEDLIHRITDFQPTPAMEAGTAFHRALELAQPGEFDCLEVNGYSFLLPSAELALPEIRELRTFKRYAGLTVTGQVDALHGTRVEDHKTTASFRPDGYLEGCQWRFYLDLFDADVFRWNVFEIKHLKDKTYQVQAQHTLEQYRYPGLHEDCAALASEFAAFLREHLPNFTALKEAA
jgi:hypothetical protein